MSNNRMMLEPIAIWLAFKICRVHNVSVYQPNYQEMKEIKLLIWLYDLYKYT